MRLNKGAYYNTVRDDLLLITKAEDRNFWNKETNQLLEESVVSFYYSNDQGDIVRVNNVLLSGSENLVYLGKY